MKRRSARLTAAILAMLGVLLIVPTIGLAVPVDLGTTSSFAILAGSTITNTGSTVINGNAGGDVGLYPGTAFPGQAQVTLSGTVHLADTVASIAKDDLVAAYNDAAGRTPVTTIPTELGGTTLTPGVYDSASGTFGITGTLTLDAQGDPNAEFVFKTSSTLITASNSSVSLINNARPCRVWWQVGSSATLGTNSHFVGHIFALTSISANTGATAVGQLLARNGAVTLDTNTITNALCLEATTTPAIYVSKTASPSSLVGTGAVTFTYVVTNAGNIPLSGVTVVDDQVSPVTYVSGDTNSDDLLQPGEMWIYTSATTLSATTTNTATAEGVGNTTTATATSAITVVVAAPAPAIHLVKSASPRSLTSGPGWVTYTYTVTNPGNVALSAVSVTDNKISGLTYSSGDTNGDGLLQPGETWIYQKRVFVRSTITNTATARGTGTGAGAGVAVSSGTSLRISVSGGVIGSGQIPGTATPWYNLLLLGAALALAGVFGTWRYVRRAPKSGTPVWLPMARGLSVGLVAVGIGCVGWAFVGTAQPIDSLEGYPGSSASEVTLAKASASTVSKWRLEHPKVGNKLGVLWIPKLRRSVPVVEGTTDSQLKRGAGHFRGSVMPGGADNCVISGHRDTVFTKLGRLKQGDRIVVTTAAGRFTYKVRRTKIVSAGNKSVVVHTSRAVLTLTTCYPFRFVGTSNRRYVVTADLVKK